MPTSTATAEPSASVLYFSLTSPATFGTLSVADEDIVALDSAGGFSLLFDGSDVGLSSFSIDAFAVIAPDQLIMSFSEPGAVPGVAGTVDDSDIVRFHASSLGGITTGMFTMYFDGSDVGLTANAEDVTGVELLAGGQLVIGSLNGTSVPGLSTADDDLAVFTPTSLGAATTGTWSFYFDGSDVGITGSGEDLDAVAVSSIGRMYFSTSTGFSAGGVSAPDEDVSIFIPSALGPATAGSFAAAAFFDGSAYGVGVNDVTAVDLP